MKPALTGRVRRPPKFQVPGPVDARRPDGIMSVLGASIFRRRWCDLAHEIDQDVSRLFEPAMVSFGRTFVAWRSHDPVMRTERERGGAPVWKCVPSEYGEAPPVEYVVLIG